MDKKHMELLGYHVIDVVTGFKGVVSSISFDLYGCVQAIVSPKMDKDGGIGDGRWFDTKRLRTTSPKLVMEVPTFNIPPGGQKLPKYQEMPVK